MSEVALTQPQRRLIENYLRALDEADLDSGPDARRAALRFCTQVGDANLWAELSLEEQCGLDVRVRRIVSWLLVTQRVRASAGYLVTGSTFLGHIGARHHARLFVEFQSTGQSIGFIADRIRRQWSAVMRVSALLGVHPEDLTTAHLASGRAALVTECKQRERPGQAERLSMAIFQAGATLFHLGVTQEVLAQRSPTSPDPRAARWAAVADGLPTTIAAYLEQISLSLAPATVNQIEGALREFATFLTALDPEVAGIKDVGRAHIEAYKKWLVERPSARGERLRRQTVGKRLAIVRTMCERLIAWGWEDAPASVPVLAGDAPLPEQRLPRFIDDGSSARLLAAARSDSDPFVRLCVEFLARTGLRKGEFLDLELDCVVRIGSAYWLRVPLGKLRNDRYIPLHPELKALLDSWLARRPASLRSNLVFVERGRRISPRRVDQALVKAATAAGIGHVSAHQLRHTLATQAINRGMSLEALAALLGHKSLSMTLVYAKIADRTVSDEYFAVSEKVESLYQRPPALPASDEGTKMTALRREMDRRMLGNGYCARPLELDCHFESICESCTFFVTTLEFRPTLERQRDDAAAKGQRGRERIFDDLLQRLESDAS